MLSKRHVIEAAFGVPQLQLPVLSASCYDQALLSESQRSTAAFQAPRRCDAVDSGSRSDAPDATAMALLFENRGLAAPFPDNQLEIKGENGGD